MAKDGEKYIELVENTLKDSGALYYVYAGTLLGQKLEMKSAGLQKRSYCYSIDCAVQILIVLLKGKSGQAYNIGHDEITTIREMAEICARAGNVELTMTHPTEAELKAFNPMNNSALDNTRVKNLGYSDVFSTKNGIMHTVDILKEINS